MNNHDWNVTPSEAVQIQRDLQSRVSIEPLQKEIKVIAGVDVSLNMFEKDIYAGVVLLSYPDMQVLGHSVIKSRTDFPYIPGLLSFREIPALLECFKTLPEMPDLVMVDGQGIAHPRHFGIASHLGVILDIPTIGCGKSKLYGSYTEPTEVGQAESIIDPKTGELLGKAFKSKARSNPLIISPGHKVSVNEALAITKACLRGYRLPEPTRQAHLLTNAFRKGEIDK
jgi:deoxyribonuclease V